MNKSITYHKNPQLKTIESNWPGTPVDEDNCFVNEEFPFVPKMGDVFKWMLSKNPQKREKQEDSFRLAAVHDTSFLNDNRDCILWLGHASFFIRLNGIRVLIDPVFYNIFFVKRYAQHAFGPSLFQHVDYLLISHDHQDHCQEKSIQEIVSANPNITVLTGLNMESLLKPWCKNVPIQTAGWYQQYETGSAIEIDYMPTRHWSKRGIYDANKRLWGAFILKGNNKTIYFGGDSGYGNHFKELKVLFPRIDIAMLGIGAYKPEWFMHPNHISPADAVRAFHDMEAEVLIPMHYGTFDLSDEPPGEPLRILEAFTQRNEFNGTLNALQIGESFFI